MIQPVAYPTVELALTASGMVLPFENQKVTLLACQYSFVLVLHRNWEIRKRKNKASPIHTRNEELKSSENRERKWSFSLGRGRVEDWRQKLRMRSVLRIA
nr:hypothetical protein Iba_chr11aCG8960 [Ipomoea batatas]